MQSNAEQFADELPSVRRVFALEVIAQASVKWKQRRKLNSVAGHARDCSKWPRRQLPRQLFGSFRNLGSRDLGKSMTLPPPSKLA